MGLSDGQNTELIEGDLQQGQEVVTNVVLAAEARPAATSFPFGQPGRGGPGGFPGGPMPPAMGEFQGVMIPTTPCASRRV